ncbi:MAG: Rid family hydrolase [Pseudomonadota bacterium]
MVSDDVAAQAEQALKNLATVLDQAGSGLDRVVKTTLFITDMSDYPVVNAAYASAFGEHTPARSCVGVAALPLGALVEVEAIAKLRD